MLQATATSSSDVQAVTNLASWYAFSHNVYNDAKASALDKMRYSNHFFLPDMAVIPTGKLTFKYANTGIFWDAVWTFLFVELFDSFGSAFHAPASAPDVMLTRSPAALTGIMTRAGWMRGNPERAMQRVNRAMCIDGLGLWVGGLLGSNSITCYIESNTGIEAGARTGFASVVTGSMFFLSLLFVAPFVQIIPSAATTCALFMVGVYSLDGVRDIDFSDFSQSFPAFMTIATMAFTYSIANGSACRSKNALCNLSRLMRTFHSLHGLHFLFARYDDTIFVPDSGHAAQVAPPAAI